MATQVGPGVADVGSILPAVVAAATGSSLVEFTPFLDPSWLVLLQNLAEEDRLTICWLLCWMPLDFDLLLMAQALLVPGVEFLCKSLVG